MVSSGDVTNWTAQQRIDAFKEEFVSEMMRDPHVTDVRFFGSAHETWRWRQGHSNVDIIVEGDHIPRDVKLGGVKLVEKLNYKYRLGLENTPFYHPTPFYIDSLVADPMSDILPRLKFITMPMRAVMKAIGKAGKWPVTHEDVWNHIDKLPKVVQNTLIV